MVSTISTTRPSSRIRFSFSIPLWSASLSTSIRMTLRQVRHERRRGRTQEPILRLPLCGGIEVNKKLHLSGREDRDRDAIAVDDAIAGQRRQSRPRRQNSDEVKRVCAGE